VSLRSLVLLRILVGPVVLLHLRPFLADALDGRIYRDAFYEPYASWYPELPRSVYVGLLWVGAVAAIAMSLGILTRIATATTFGVVAYNLFLSTTHVHSNRAYLVIILGGLVLAGGACNETGPAWPLWLLRLEASVVYGASGLSKLQDPDWFGGTVTWLRTIRVRDELASSPLPHWAQDVLTNRSFHTGAAKVIVLTELFIALGLWWRGTRYAAVWVAVCFHVAIQATASVQVFSFLAIAALVIWAVPSTRDRMLVIDVTDKGQRRLGRAVGWLDWLHRFQVERGGSASALQVTDRDGRALQGRSAVVVLLSRLPLTAWLALPLRRFR
jgi:hypothetical protein